MAGPVDAAPDLHALTTELFSAARRQWPGLISEADVKRVEEARDPLLVGLRVVAAVMERAGLPRSEVDAAVRRASDPRPHAVASGPADIDPDPAHEHRVPRFDQLLAEIDAAMLSPAERSRFSPWFIGQFWPGLLRRIARGERGTSRDQSILLRELERSSGRRW
jgi:hypothetical protein